MLSENEFHRDRAGIPTYRPIKSLFVTNFTIHISLFDVAKRSVFGFVAGWSFLEFNWLLPDCFAFVSTFLSQCHSEYDITVCYEDF